MYQPLSEIAYKALKVVQDRSSREGLDLFEELNKTGRLATEPRIRDIRVSALRNMQERFLMMSPDDFLREMDWHLNNSNPATPSDLLRAVDLWLMRYIQSAERD